jgi:phospholipase C
MRFFDVRSVFAVASVLAVWGCGGGGSVSVPPGKPGPTPTHAATSTPSPRPSPTPTPSPTPSPTPLTVPSPGQVTHVVFIVQENRSFDNLFQAYPGADTSATGFTSTGSLVSLKPTPLETPGSHGHFLVDFLGSYDNGKMDGFNLGTGKLANYGYVPQSEVKPYWQMAQQFVLADRMFPSNIDASFVAHQYLIAGQAASTVDIPSANWGCTGPPTDLISTLTSLRTYGPQVVPCFDYTTLADELMQAHLSWHYYAPPINLNGGLWSAYQAVNHICGPISGYNGACTGPNWVANVTSPETQVLSDVPAGMLANVTWIVPDFANSDHPGSLSTTGPSWVASLVNTIGESPFWRTSVIFVVWDEWGGWYDHVPPPQLDVDGLGIRVPLLCISPYAAQGVVSHVQYEFGSVLRFAEDAFRLGRLSASDRRATSAAVGCLNFAQKPRAFVPIGTARQRIDFRHQRPSNRPPDDH